MVAGWREVRLGARLTFARRACSLSFCVLERARLTLTTHLLSRPAIVGACAAIGCSRTANRTERPLATDIAVLFSRHHNTTSLSRAGRTWQSRSSTLSTVAPVDAAEAARRALCVLEGACRTMTARLLSWQVVIGARAAVGRLRALRRARDATRTHLALTRRMEIGSAAESTRLAWQRRAAPHFAVATSYANFTVRRVVSPLVCATWTARALETARGVSKRASTARCWPRGAASARKPGRAVEAVGDTVCIRDVAKPTWLAVGRQLEARARWTKAPWAARDAVNSAFSALVRPCLARLAALAMAGRRV